MLALSTRTRIEAGEVFWRRRPRLASDGLPVPLQYELIEPEFCPAEDDVARNVRAGVQYNAIGRRTAYWMHREHPGDPYAQSGSVNTVAVPASMILHHYAPLRPGQIRGVPWTIQSLVKARDFDEYDDAELVRKKERAMRAGAITRPVTDENDFKVDPLSGKDFDLSQVPPISDIEPGTWVTLAPGEEIHPFDGDNAGSGYADFVRQALLGVAAGIGVPYEFLTGDFKNVNDRLVRVILNAYHRLLEMTQWLVTIPQICDPVWVDFVDAAVAAGALAAPGYAERRGEYLSVEWRPYRWDYVHPLQDVQADSLRVNAGFGSRSQVCSERGESAEEIDRQNGEDRRRAAAEGLSYDSHNAAAGDDFEIDEEREAEDRVKRFRLLNRQHYSWAQP